MPAGTTATMRILQVTTDDDRRGGQVFASDLDAGLRALGHEVTTVALAPGAVGGLDLLTLGRRRRSPQTLTQLRRCIRGADVVVGHGSTTLPACAISSAGTGVPFVYRQISDSHFWANTAARRLRVRAGLRRAARVVALWQGAADTLVRDFGVPRGNVVCIPNAVPTGRFATPDPSSRAAARAALRLPHDMIVVAYVGALVPEKGVDVAIDAVRRRDHIALVIAGDGAARRALERRASDLGDRVRFIGSVDKPDAVYAAADVVVLPSRGGDSMPASLIEAGLMALPSVTTSVAAIPELVLHRRTGFVVEPGDVNGFSAALDRLCDDGSLRVAMGHCARQRCLQLFTIDAVTTLWSQVLQSAAEPRADVRAGQKGREDGLETSLSRAAPRRNAEVGQRVQDRLP